MGSCIESGNKDGEKGDAEPETVLLSVLYRSSLIGSGPFVLPFPASFGTVNQNILILSD